MADEPETRAPSAEAEAAAMWQKTVARWETTKTHIDDVVADFGTDKTVEGLANVQGAIESVQAMRERIALVGPTAIESGAIDPQRAFTCADLPPSAAQQKLTDEALAHQEKASAASADPAERMREFSALLQCQAGIRAKHLDAPCESVSFREGLLAGLSKETALTQLQVDMADCMMKGLTAPPAPARPKPEPSSQTTSIMVRRNTGEGR